MASFEKGMCVLCGEQRLRSIQTQLHRGGTHKGFSVKAMFKGADTVAKWIQLDLFTGEPIPPRDEKAEKQKESVEASKFSLRIAKTTRLALEVQISIARLDTFTDTMKRVGELCESVSGFAYPIDIDERRRSKQKQRQQQTERKVATEIKRAKNKRERPKQKEGYMPAESPMRQQIDNSFNRRGTRQ